jgi:hypothetical protein
MAEGGPFRLFLRVDAAADDGEQNTKSGGVPQAHFHRVSVKDRRRPRARRLGARIADSPHNIGIPNAPNSPKLPSLPLSQLDRAIEK